MIIRRNRRTNQRIAPAINMSISIVAASTVMLLLQMRDASSLAPPLAARSIPFHGVGRRAPPFASRGNGDHSSRPWTSLLLSQSEDDNASSAATTATKSPSKRAQRKAAQRATKQRKQREATGNKATSQHPEAVLKRQQRGGNNTRPNSRRRHNFAERAEFLQETEEGSDVSVAVEHPLHSTAVDSLDAGSTTADEVVQAIKRAQNLHDVHDIREIARFLIEDVDVSFAYGYRGSLLSRLAVASLHMNNYDIAEKCIVERRTSHRSSMLPMESSAIVRGLLRMHHIDEAWAVLEDELHLPPDGWVEFDPGAFEEEELHLEEEAIRRQLEVRDALVHRARSIGSIASRHFYEEEPALGMAAVGKLKDMGGIVKESGLTSEDLGMPWERYVKGAALCEGRRRDGKWDDADTNGSENNDGGNEGRWPCNIVYSVLDAMISFPPENRDVTFEALCNALVRRTVFVTGAVDMDGCPDADRGEVAFIGRSNVGKSSLVNMLTNRKALAFTSKTPGKTQQFNYFAVNDKPELARQIRYGDDVPGSMDRDAFYMVDLPGFGFAKVSQQQRQQWSDFTDEYLMQRETLRVVFHLIDARHGPTDEDCKIMQKVGNIVGSDGRKNNAKYVIVLTKADKNVKGATSEKNPGKVAESVRDKLSNAMGANGVGYAPIVVTSAETRLGRDEVWKYLRLAAES